MFTKPDGTTTTLVCGYHTEISTTVDGQKVIHREAGFWFPDADGKCRGPGVDFEYDFRGAEEPVGRVRQVTAPPPPDPVPIPSCFDTAERTTYTPSSPMSETVTQITGYSRCSEAEYYRYLDAQDQQLADHYAAEERYSEQIREQERRNEPFLICISQEEWEETLAQGPRCQLAYG